MVVLGLILVGSLITDTIARRTRLPRISLLVLGGLAFAGFQQLILGRPAQPPLGGLREPLISVALVMVAFLLGGDFTRERIRSVGKPVLVLSMTVAVVGTAVVAGGLVAATYPVTLALALAAISVATDPAAVVTAIRGPNQDSRLARVLQGIVAIDDIWGVLMFGLSMAFLGWLSGGTAASALAHAIYELGGGVCLGAAMGLPAAWLTGRLRAGEPSRTEALALILLIAGLSDWLEVSELLAAVVAGCVVANMAPHHEYSFSEIEGIEWPFLVFFFVLAGASIDLRALPSVMPLLGAYIGLRLLGRYLGARTGIKLLGASGSGLNPHLGLALTPQAGVAMGMALLAKERLPEQAEPILATVVAGTIVFETIGPVLIARVLR
jgi:NhaP-type Na+/H+ or K+/H+ antiporter